MRYFLFIFLFLSCSVFSINGDRDGIVSLSPNITDVLLAMSLANKIKGVVDDHEVLGKYEKSLTGFPIVANYNDINYEKILKLSPEYVVLDRKQNPFFWQDKLRKYGFKVVVCDFFSMKSILDCAKNIAFLYKKYEDYDRLFNKVNADIIRLKSLNESKKTYFFQVSSRDLYSFNKKHILSDALSLCGFDNIVSVQNGIINIDYVFMKNPDFIFVTNQVDASFWKRFNDLNAVKRNHIIIVSSQRFYRMSYDLLNYIEPLCKIK